MKVNSGQAPSTLIPEYIGSDFDKIVTVADNLNDIELALENINSVVTVANNILDVNKVASIADDVTLVADNIDYIKNAATGSGGSGGSGGSEGISVRWNIGDTPPTQPAAGAMWYCTLDGRTYTWYEDDDSGQWVESSPQGVTEEAAPKESIAPKEPIDGGSGGAFGGQYRNLVVTVSGVGSKGTITADRLVVEGADYSTKILRNVNLSFDGVNAGANGLDTGTVAAGNWYYIFAIYNPTTDTTASLVSLSMTAPTLPAGYTMAAILGAAYMAAGATFMPSVKKDFETSLGAGGVQGYVTILNSGSASAITPVSTDTAAPTISSAISISAVSSDGGKSGVYVDNVSMLGATVSSYGALWAWVAQKQQGVIFYKSFGGSLTIRIVGYRTPF